MINTPVRADYLVVGAGAAGMAFADQLLTDSDATIAIVDKRHRPGGHWNDAYPFVRLHQPSSNYGVNSRPLGSGGKDTTGFNAGLDELASGAEVVSYFENVMQHHLVKYLASIAVLVPKSVSLLPTYRKQPADRIAAGIGPVAEGWLIG